MNTFLFFAVANSVIFFVGFVVRHAFRNRAKGASGVKESSVARNHHSLEEQGESGFTFRFQYQITSHHEGSIEREEEVKEETKSSSIQKCSFSPEKGLSGFVEQPEVRILRVEEPKVSMITEFDSSSSSDNDWEQPAEEICSLVEIDDKQLPNDEGLEKGMHAEAHVISEEFSGFDSEADSISLSDGYSVHDLLVESDGFLSEKDSDEHEKEGTTKNSPAESACSSPKDLFLGEKAAEPEQINLHQEEVDSSPVHKSQETDVEFTDSSDDDDDAYLDELRNADQSDAKTPNRDLHEQLHTAEAPKRYPDCGILKPEKTNPNNSGEEDYDGLESLWEHQDLIEQLRTELRKMRDIGLPTILEESESPRTADDLKPPKLDESLFHEDHMDELQRSYRNYREGMRNFDMLNYQKMYAIGFLQLDDPLRSKKAYNQLISLGFRSIRRRTIGDPLEKLMKELQSDLEMVYVGQTCLSWEFLRWQYEKAREMPATDPFRSHHYSQVAGEFQQFQVLVQRFIENESFQGPRLPNYIRNRCVLRSLLQVPLIREDCFKDKMEDEQRGITSEVLEDIMEEAIRVFWEFVKADKDETPVILKGFMGTHVELQDPEDADLVEDIQSDLYKKEKRLKDMQRSGNCLVKKLKRPKEDRSNQDLFFSQVDLKLVARVLRMPRITTEQLLWCHKKLSNIKLVERKIFREPAFLLFPC